MGRECGTYGMQETRILGLVGKREGKRLLGRRRHKCDDNIKMGLQYVVWGGIDWVDLAEDRYRWRALVKAVLNLWVP